MRKLFLPCLLAIGALVAATPAPAADPPNTTYKLNPRKVDGIPTGKAELVMGRAGETAHRFYLENLNMLVPVVVTLRPGSKDADARVAVTKYAWDQPLRQGSTKGGKQVSFRFRTQGEFQIAVTGAKPGTPYKLLVWVGDELKPAFKPVVISKSEFEKATGSSGFGSIVSWVIALALLGILGLLAVLALRRKRA